MNIGITPDKVFTDSTGAAISGYQHALNAAATYGIAGPPVADLDRRHRPDGRPVHPASRDRRPVLLRHVVGHRELADDLRLLARRRDPRQLASGTASTSAPGRPPTRSGWPRSGRSSWACPTCIARSHTPRSPRSRSSACTSPTWPRSSCVCAQAASFKAGPWTLGRWSKPDRDHRHDLGDLHLRPVHAPAGPADQRSTTSTTRRSCSSSSSAGRRSGTLVSAKNWFKGPKVQGTPEELAAIEQELEIA